MSPKNKILIIILGIGLLLTPLAVYFIHFYNQPISNDSERWGQFGDYLNGTFMPIIALVGVLVTLLLGLISDNRNMTNIKIDQQKQRPLLHIGYFDGEEKIRIFMKNKGNGPLIIFNYRLVNLKTGEEISGIYECLPPIMRNFDNYTGNQQNTVLSANEVVELLLFKHNVGDKLKTFESSRELIRKALANYKIVVTYNDVYDNKMPTYEKSLIWFGRHDDRV